MIEYTGILTPQPNHELLGKIADAILLKSSLFDMSNWGAGSFNPETEKLDCHTPLCIAGWACILADAPVSHYMTPNENGEPEPIVDVKGTAMELLGLTGEQANALFHSCCWPEAYQERFRKGQDNVTDAKTAYDRIHHFIATGE